MVVALATMLLLSGCGGGDSGGDGGAATASTAAAVSDSNGLPSSTALAGQCTLEGQQRFVRSYLDETYLWYDEIQEIAQASYTHVADYFDALLVRSLDAGGRAKDRFSTVMTTSAADALQSAASQPGATATGSLDGHSASRSVPLWKVLASDSGRRVGYLLFNDHSTGAQDGLITAFDQLRSAAVQDLVLDMRNNYGGYLYVAQAAASMVAGPGHEGQVFEQLRYNSKRTAAGTATTFSFSTRVETAETQYPVGYPLPQLALPRVYVLTSPITCSASESVINSLRGIDVEVILVGDTTCGKPYGFRRKDNCGLALYAIEFQGYNAKGYGDYQRGFAPTCQVTEDLKAALGSRGEPLLAAALRHADTGSCPAVTASPSAAMMSGVAPATGPLISNSMAGALQQSAALGQRLLQQ